MIKNNTSIDDITKENEKDFSKFSNNICQNFDKILKENNNNFKAAIEEYLQNYNATESANLKEEAFVQENNKNFLNFNHSNQNLTSEFKKNGLMLILTGLKSGGKGSIKISNDSGDVIGTIGYLTDKSSGQRVCVLKTSDGFSVIPEKEIEAKITELAKSDFNFVGGVLS